MVQFSLYDNNKSDLHTSPTQSSGKHPIQEMTVTNMMKDDMDEPELPSFSNHTFYGPKNMSTTTAEDNERTLHDIRRVELKHPRLKIPYFKSEPQDRLTRRRMSLQLADKASSFSEADNVPSSGHRPMNKIWKRAQLLKTLPTNMSMSFSVLPSFMKHKYGGGQKNQLQVSSMTMCNGCDVYPIKGTIWSCSVCEDFNLCSLCYSQGVHGMEGTSAMQMYQELTIYDKLMKRCKLLTLEFLGFLYRDICKKKLGKFEHFGLWLASIVDKNTSAR
jgi:hypothetical protein